MPTYSFALRLRRSLKVQGTSNGTDYVSVDLPLSSCWKFCISIRLFGTCGALAADHRGTHCRGMILTFSNKRLSAILQIQDVDTSSAYRKGAYPELFPLVLDGG